MKRANAQDMNMMLDGMLLPGDAYNVKVFAQIIPTSPIYYLTMCGGALGALIGGLFQDEFGSARLHNAYIGFTNNSMNFAVLDDWHIDKFALAKTFSLADITKVNFTDKMVAFQATIWFGKKKIRISIPKKVRKTDLAQQADCIAVIKDYLTQVKNAIKAQKKAA